MEEPIFKIIKTELKTEVNQLLLQYSPELYGQLDSPLLKETLVYIEGYCKCLNSFVEHPYNRKEVRALILSEATSFILKRLKS